MFKKHQPALRDVSYALAADHNAAVSRAYGVYQETSGVNQRGRFIINPEGTIMGVEILAGPIGRNTEELIRQVQAMQAVAANPGMAAPAGWKPGDKLISTRVPEDIGRY
jgi:alkyl hydroperoxide reductase subunit AhpC